MKANVTYTDDKPDSFVVSDDRTQWYWGFNDGTAEFQRVEVSKYDDHPTETAVVLFGSEWHRCKEFVNNLRFVDEITVQETVE